MHCQPIALSTHLTVRFETNKHPTHALSGVLSYRTQTNYIYFSFRFDLGQYLVPEHIYKDVEDVLTYADYDPEKGLPVVTGAYQLTEFELQYKKLDLCWWCLSRLPAQYHHKFPQFARVAKYYTYLLQMH